MGSIFIALDSSLLTEGRFILSDGMLHFWSALHIFALSLFLRYQTDTLALFAGLTLGGAAVCKYTGLGLFAVDAVTQFVWFVRLFLVKPIDWLGIFGKIARRGAAFLMPAACVMSAAWVWHFAANPYAGYHSHNIDRRDAHTILDKSKINVSYWGNRVSRSSLVGRVVRWNQAMNRINMKSKIPHPWESRPEYWPFLLDKYVLFWARDYRRIQCMGLPASYWFTTLGLFLTVPAGFCGKSGWQNWLFVWAWAVSYLPFLRIPRTMFHYHYLIPLMFASLNASAFVSFAFRNRFVRSALCAFCVILTFLCYLYFSPLIYGTDCPDCTRTRSWVKAWGSGPPKPVNCFGKALINTSELILDKLPL
jgi:dolichyl-phosphate-mannose-protein mannosyltransferase